jgi:hypothetical protein
MALGDAMFGLGIGLQGQAKLNMNAPMQAFKQRQAAKAAAKKDIDDFVKDAMKDFTVDEKFHPKYVNLASQEISKTFDNIYGIIEKGDINAKNQINSIIRDELAPKINVYRTSSQFLFDREKVQDELLPPNFVQTLTDPDFSTWDPQTLLDYNISYNPETKAIAGTPDKAVDLIKLYKPTISNMASREYAGEREVTDDQGKTKTVGYFRPDKQTRQLALDNLLQTNALFSKTFMRQYGLNTLDPADPTVQKAKETWDESTKDVHGMTKDVTETVRTGAGRTTVPTTTTVVAADTDTKTGPEVGSYLATDGKTLVNAGTLSVRKDLYDPIAIAKVAEGPSSAIVFQSNEIIPLRSAASGAGARDTGSVYKTSIVDGRRTMKNKYLSGSATQSMYDMTAYPVEVVSKSFTLKGTKGDVFIEKGTVITSNISNSIPDDYRQVKLGIVGKTVTDATADPGSARDAIIIVDKSNFVSTLTRLDKDATYDKDTGLVNFGSDQAKQFVKLYNEIYGAKKKEMGGEMGSLSLDDYISLPAKERLNYIRTPEGMYKKK